MGSGEGKRRKGAHKKNVKAVFTSNRNTLQRAETECWEEWKSMLKDNKC